MNIIFPMLGNGSRFFLKGYKIPKYLLPLAEENILYFVLYGFRKLSKNRFIFVVRKDHLQYGVNKEIIRICNVLNIKDFKILEVDKLTRGQADSVKFAFPLCIIKQPILIFNIDTIHLALDPLFDEEYDGILETFYAKGDHWSFAEVDDNNLVKKVVEKKRISSNCSNGLYYFNNLNLFNYCYSETYLSESNKEIDYLNETYIAPIYNVLIKNGKRVFNRNIDKNDILPAGVPNEYIFLNSKFKLKKELENEFKDF
tara:strand:- start:146 stop:913 length:768 start_codon:yes stop_codon:yes gene_type:complete